MKWNAFRSLLVCVLPILVASVFTPIKNISASEFDPSQYITFGVYSGTSQGIVESESVPFENHVLYGLSLGIYNYYAQTYGNNNSFPQDFTVIRSRLINGIGQDFWNNVSTYRFLCNAYRYNSGSNEYLVLAFSRASYDNGKVFERSVNMSDLVTFEILPETYNGSRYLMVDVSNSSSKRYQLFSVLPYFNRNDLGIAGNSYLESLRYGTTFSDLVQAMTSQALRSFFITIQVGTPSLSLTFFDTSRINAYTNDVTFAGTAQPYIMANVVPIMTDFPVYSYDSDTYNTSNAFLYSTSGSYYDVRLYYNRLPNVYWWEDMSPVLVSGYESIPDVTPTPTFTPSPQPTWTPYPTSTPFPPVNEIEGISQMMTLFTRKYEFNINGNVIGIRPLYLFVFTFLVGAIFKAIQGGDRN